MANRFGTDILIQALDPEVAAAFYVEQLGFEITGATPNMISIHGNHLNLFIERGPALGPVFEVTVANVEITFTPPWDPRTMASDDAKVQLGIW